MKKHFPLATTMALMLAASAAPAWAYENVRGVVVDKKTNKPLFGATIRLQGTQMHTLTTDTAGTFLLENLPAKIVKKLDKQLALADEKVAIMIEESVGAFRTCDRERAEKVFSMDDEVDVIYAEAEQAIIDMIRSGKTSAKYLPELLMVAKYFERMADDAERIADWAVFRVTGRHEVHSQENYIEMEAARAQLANDAESGASEE